MFKWLTKVVVIAFVFLGLANIIQGVEVIDFKWSILSALVLSILNATIRPIMKIISFPITLITFGLFTIVINAAVLLIVDKIMGAKFELGGFWNAVVVAIVLTVVNIALEKILSKKSLK